MFARSKSYRSSPAVPTQAERREKARARSGFCRVAALLGGIPELKLHAQPEELIDFIRAVLTQTGANSGTCQSTALLLQ